MDTNKVGMYVVPMFRNIEFTVKLLEDTLTFVKRLWSIKWWEHQLSTNWISYRRTTAMGVGTSLMALGTLLNRRKKRVITSA